MTLDKKFNLPRSVVLELTENCNLRCKMCFYWGETGCYSIKNSKRKPVVMELELVKRIVTDLAPVKPRYSLFGGEPLMYPHIEKVIQMIKNSGSIMDTPTNGTLLTKYAAMLVRTGFDLVRVSIDGPREINDDQRGKGSYAKATAGIEALNQEKQKERHKKPFIDVIYTITPTNHLSIEEFFLNDLNLSAINSVSIQMENYMTEKMGLEFAHMLESEFGIKTDMWRGCVRSPEFFKEMDITELCRQVDKVSKELRELGKAVLRLPPTFSPKNLTAYLQADWNNMTNLYERCPSPWSGVDITASGDLAPCHVFFDLVMGNLYENSFEEIWNGENYTKFRKYMEHNHLMSICPGCCILYLGGKKLRKRKSL